MSLGQPFPNLRNRPPTDAQRTAVSGTPLDLDLLTLDRMRAALAAMAPTFRPKELDVLQFRGEPYFIGYRPHASVLVRGRGGSERGTLRATTRASHRLSDLLRNGDPFGGLTTTACGTSPGRQCRRCRCRMPCGCRSTTPTTTTRMATVHSRYYASATRIADSTWLYLDPHLGTMTRQDRGARWNRWLYHGLHNLDFPFLYYKRPLWDVVVILLSIGGLALSATTLVPTWHRLARHARRAGRAIRGVLVIPTSSRRSPSRASSRP